MVMMYDPDGLDGSGGTGRGGSGGGGNAWVASGTNDRIDFTLAPPNGVAIHVVEYAAGSALKATALWSLGAWCDAFGYPSEVEFYNARLWWASSRDQPQSVWASSVEAYATFKMSTPIQDDDSITARIASRTLQECRDLVPMQNLIILSTGGAWKVSGGDSEVITPTNITFKPQVAEPASHLPALMVGSSAIYATSSGWQVRDLSFAFEADGYVGNDLTAFCTHLTRYHAFVDWDYAAIPYTHVLTVRDDGVMLSMTYKKEHQVVGWSRFTTRGQFGSIATIPEWGTSGVYVAVLRTLGGIERVCIERQAEPTPVVEDWVGLDCSLTYDGRNKGATTVTVAGPYGHDDLQTVTATAAIFAASNVGDYLVLGYGKATFTRLEIVEFISATQVRTSIDTAVDPAWQGVATVDWAIAADHLLGLDHLEGETVDVVGDGMLLGQYVVSGGAITVDRPSAVVHVGFAYWCDAQTLEPNFAGAETMQGKRKLIRRVDLTFESSRNVSVGMAFDKLEPIKSRGREDMAGAPAPINGLVDGLVSCDWAESGKVCIRAGGGLPATLLAISPHVGIGQ